MNILNLENHAIFAQQVTQQFLAGHNVTVVPSLFTARTAITSGTYDPILSDYDLNDGKGEAFVRECRTHYRQIPIIAVSSHAEGNAALLKAGAVAVCDKMHFDRIEQIISNCFR